LVAKLAPEIEFIVKIKRAAEHVARATARELELHVAGATAAVRGAVQREKRKQIGAIRTRERLGLSDAMRGEFQRRTAGLGLFHEGVQTCVAEQAPPVTLVGIIARLCGAPGAAGFELGGQLGLRHEVFRREIAGWQQEEGKQQQMQQRRVF
jgi:hypothetical protein